MRIARQYYLPCYTSDLCCGSSSLISEGHLQRIHCNAPSSAWIRHPTLTR